MLPDFTKREKVFDQVFFVLLGEFRKFAIHWQFSSACQVAGFLGVLSSELSVFTLTVITLERHYVITHAMHLNKVRQIESVWFLYSTYLLPLSTPTCHRRM